MASRQIGHSQARRYRMGERAVGFHQTRDRIVNAAARLHGLTGVRETSWEAIGKRAGVSTATVYRHFPTLDSLIPACAQAAFAAGAQLPTTAQLAGLFSGLATSSERLKRVITESCRCYERGEAWLDAARREAGNVRPLADAVRTQERALDALISAAVGPQTARHHKGALKALCDFPFWKSLVDAGVPRSEAPAIIADLALRVVEQSRR
ncbi:MAG: TetR/AcrR family transcriptional regulator [Candidatus Dormibacteraeota bacterium]|nr:TetR/AcrR family transcriptional regulator [Candidatus Dormibacteraeota bacterium]